MYQLNITLLLGIQYPTDIARWCETNPKKGHLPTPVYPMIYVANASSMMIDQDFVGETLVLNILRRPSNAFSLSAACDTLWSFNIAMYKENSCFISKSSIDTPLHHFCFAIVKFPIRYSFRFPLANHRRRCEPSVLGAVSLVNSGKASTTVSWSKWGFWNLVTPHWGPHPTW